jgi:outer membrane protein W
MGFPGAAVIRLVAVAALSACAGCASAGSGGESSGGSEFARPGPYAGLYAIQSYENFDTSDSRVRSGNSDLGAGLRVGYRTTPCFAVEVIAENVKGFSVSQGNVEDDLDLLNFALAGKYFLADGRLQPYLLGGAGLARADVRSFDFDNHGWFLRGGLGVDVYVATSVAVFGELNYNRMMGGKSDLHHIDAQLGLLIRF